ncbi:MAG: hypothetical protein NTV94_05150 [Planctomycetota bacterium]|nr:hypothetical protein [Planctomycetota bacterium]
MKNVIGSLVAIAGMAVAANADTSKLDILVSKDGVNWSPSATFNPTAGETRAYVAYVMSYVGTSAAPNAFASLTFQPVFSNVRASDSVVAFANSGNNTNGGAIDGRGDYSAAGGFGRLKPWAATGPSTSQSYVVHSHSASAGGAPAGNFFRIARNDVTRWMGTGTTTGTAAVNNFNGAGGVVAGQKQAPGAADPARVAGTQNLVLMVLALNIGAVAPGASHTIVADAPLAGMSRNATTGAREASWWANTSENAASIKANVEVVGGEINIIPAPGALALLGLGGLVVGRRRR